MCKKQSLDLRLWHLWLRLKCDKTKRRKTRVKEKQQTNTISSELSYLCKLPLDKGDKKSKKKRLEKSDTQLKLSLNLLSPSTGRTPCKLKSIQPVPNLLLPIQIACPYSGHFRLVFWQDQGFFSLKFVFVFFCLVFFSIFGVWWCGSTWVVL